MGMIFDNIKLPMTPQINYKSYECDRNGKIIIYPSIHSSSVEKLFMVPALVTKIITPIMKKFHAH